MFKQTLFLCDQYLTYKAQWCRISVFTEKGETKIGLIKPEQMLATLSSDASLAAVAKEVELKTMLMVDEAK